MLTIEDLLTVAAGANASDVHITVGVPPKFRINGSLITSEFPRMLPPDTEAIMNDILDSFENGTSGVSLVDGCAGTGKTVLAISLINSLINAINIEDDLLEAQASEFDDDIDEDKKIALYGPGATKTIKGGTGSGEVKERYVVNILEGLVNKGLEITTMDWLNEYETIYNRELSKFNKEKKKKVNLFNITGIMGQLALEFQAPVGSRITRKTIADTCIYVLCRQAGEAGDRKLEKGDYYLLDEEYEAIKKCASLYKNFILVINAGSSIDLSFVDEIKGIDAILYVSQLGMEMGNAVASIITGEVNPSGKLTNTWVNNYSDIPFSNEYALVFSNTFAEFLTVSEIF